MPNKGDKIMSTNSIDLTNLSEEETKNLDALIKRLVDREKNRLEDVSSHANDHRSDHHNQAQLQEM